MSQDTHIELGQVLIAIAEPHRETLDTYHRWFEEEALPRDVPKSPADQVLIFTPRNFPSPDPNVPLTPGSVNENPRVGEGLLLLYCLGEEPRAAWQPYFASLGEEIAKSGRGRVALAAPFVPTPRGKPANPKELW